MPSNVCAEPHHVEVKPFALRGVSPTLPADVASDVEERRGALQTSQASEPKSPRPNKRKAGASELQQSSKRTRVKSAAVDSPVFVCDEIQQDGLDNALDVAPLAMRYGSVA